MGYPASNMGKTTEAGNQKMEGGFTLLEILIAIFIFALIISAVFTAYRGTFNIIDETESQEDIYQMARIALERITGDLASAYFPEATQTGKADQADSEPILFHGEKSGIGDLRCGELRFLSLAHLDFSDEKCLAEPAEIAYYGATGSEEGVLDLYRSDTSLARERPESGTGGLLLCKGLSSIDFIYCDAEGEPHEDWDSDEGFSKGKLPSRVSIMMEFPNPKDPERPYRFMTGIAIPMGG
jgi:general secretion pathway protein J